MTIIVLTDLRNLDFLEEILKTSQNASLILLSDATYLIDERKEFSTIVETSVIKDVYVLNSDIEKRGLINSNNKVFCINYRQLISILMREHNIINM